MPAMAAEAPRAGDSTILAHLAWQAKPAADGWLGRCRQLVDAADGMWERRAFRTQPAAHRPTALLVEARARFAEASLDGWLEA